MFIEQDEQQIGKVTRMSPDQLPDYRDYGRCHRGRHLRPDPSKLQGDLVREGGDVRLLHRGDLPQDAEGPHPPPDCPLPDHSCRVSGPVSIR